jgi:hypothetical protein
MARFYENPMNQPSRPTARPRMTSKAGGTQDSGAGQKPQRPISQPMPPGPPPFPMPPRPPQPRNRDDVPERRNLPARRGEMPERRNLPYFPGRDDGQIMPMPYFPGRDDGQIMPMPMPMPRQLPTNPIMPDIDALLRAYMRQMQGGE